MYFLLLHSVSPHTHIHGCSFTLTVQAPSSHLYIIGSVLDTKDSSGSEVHYILPHYRSATSMSSRTGSCWTSSHVLSFYPHSFRLRLRTSVWLGRTWGFAPHYPTQFVWKVKDLEWPDFGFPAARILHICIPTKVLL